MNKVVARVVAKQRQQLVIDVEAKVVTPSHNHTELLSKNLQRGAVFVGIALGLPFLVMLTLLTVAPSVPRPSLNSRYSIAGLCCLGIALMVYGSGPRVVYYDQQKRETPRVALEDKATWLLIAAFSTFAIIAFYMAITV
jgi:hypothetical protein